MIVRVFPGIVADAQLCVLIPRGEKLPRLEKCLSFLGTGRGGHSTRARDRRPRVPTPPHSFRPRSTLSPPWRLRSPPRSSSRRRSRRSPPRPPSRTTRRTTRPCRSRPTRTRPPTARKGCVARYRPCRPVRSLDAVSLVPRAQPRAPRARARVSFPAHSCAAPDALPPSSVRRPRQYEQLPQSFLCIEELQNCGISMTDIKVRASAADACPSRASRCPSPPLRARALKPDVVFFFALDARRRASFFF